MRVAVAILNWNGKSWLENFLPHVLKFSPAYVTIYVIDNNSSDNSIDFLQSHFPSVKIIQNKKNAGFAGGYNEGLKNITADYYVLLNSDVQVTANWIEPVIALMETDPLIAACQPKLLNYNVRDEFEYAGGAGGFIDRWGYPFCRGRIFNSFEKDAGQYNDKREVFWASGACLFIRAEIFHQVGGLDEDFFAHMEEIDLCWRIRNLGYKIFYCPDAVVFHVGAGTLAKMNPQKTFYNFRNNLLMLCKNHASGYLVIKLLLRGVLDGIAALKFLFAGDLSHFYAVFKAHMSFYSMIGKTIDKRHSIKKDIRQYAGSCVYNGSIVWQYFVLRKKKFSQLHGDIF